jgi:polyisoprenoid-binding protein YceI
MHDDEMVWMFGNRNAGRVGVAGDGEGLAGRSRAQHAHDLAHAKFDVTIDITSLDTQNGERDHAALGADFFDTAKFPKAHFVTTAFHKSADGKIIAEGVLTLRGVSKPVALTVSFKPNGNAATLDVTAQVKRLDFGIGTGQWADPSMIGDGVAVHGHLQLQAGK